MLLLTLAPGLGAQTRLDTLLKQLNTPGESKAVVFGKIATYYSGQNRDSGLLYARKALEALGPKASLTEKIEAYNANTTVLNATGNYKQAISNSLQVLGWAEELRDSAYLALANQATGKGYFEIGSYETALKYYDVARKIRTRQKDSILLASTMTQIGVLYHQKGEYEKAQDAHLQALRIYVAKRDQKGQARAYNNLGSVYLNQGMPEDGLRYYQLSLKLKQLAKADKRELSSAYANVGVAWFNLLKYDSALHYYDVSLKLKQDLGEKKGIGIAFNNIALVYRETNQLAKAEEFLEKAITIRREINDKRGIGSSLTALASIYQRNKKHTQAVQLLNEAEELGKELDSKSLLLEVYAAQATSNAALGNFEKAYAYDTLTRGVKDSIFDDEREKTINEMKARFDNEVQDLKIKELEQQKTESDLRQAADKERERSQNFLVGGAAILLVLILVFVLLRYRENQKSKKRLQAAFDEIESKNKDITDSIRYAQRIQRAVLPEPEEVTQLFPDSFVLYKPKDIVSGDFYWVSSNPDHSLHIIVVADCTGHGVPGAFMSLVGTDYLNQSVKNPAITDCAAALHFLDDGIIRHLKQGGETENRDGMDIALCAWSPKEKILMYSGAFRPLILMQNGELKEIEPSRFSIGGAYTDKKVFANHTVQLNSGDVFYLFTDGFSDQFGGPDGKKFKSKQLKEILLKIHQEPMSAQRRLLEEKFESWRGDLEQIDDVCVVGVRV
ncbi:MAG: protein serine/threonine phosphatase [Bacteroidetes bacterium]|nr:MAG: protein serine/threonine phosphatase [Bacteroidota bacterium]